MLPTIIALAIAGLVAFRAMFRVLAEYERGVIFRLGRVRQAAGPGLVLLLPVVDQMQRVSLRTVVLDVEKQDVITRDNVSIAVNAVVYLQVTDPVKAVISVEDYLYATGQLAQTTLRSVAGQVELDELLSNRDEINAQLRKILDEHTDPWGVEVNQVEVKHIDLPAEMQRAMARQAEAERDRRAKVINAEGELQASEKLSQAAKVLHSEPAALQLRYLQTLTEISLENSSTVLFPMPIDLVKPFLAHGSTSEPSDETEPPPAEG